MTVNYVGSVFESDKEEILFSDDGTDHANVYIGDGDEEDRDSIKRYTHTIIL